jgi:hypothetical protein
MATSPVVGISSGAEHPDDTTSGRHGEMDLRQCPASDGGTRHKDSGPHDELP